MNGFFQSILESFPYKASNDQWSAAKGVANEILGLRAEADVNETMDSGNGTHEERRRAAHAIPQNSLEVPENGLNDPDIDGYVKTARLVNYKYEPVDDGGELKTFKLMHSPNEGNDNKFSFELLDANGGLGDVFSSLEKPDWLVWCYKSMVLVCDAKAFLAELKSTYNSNDLQDLAAFTADFINELNAAKGKKDTADVINKYTGVVGDFAIYVRQNDGRLFRGSNGEFMVEISAKALTRRFPVQEYQTLNGALKRNKPEMDEAMADRKRETEMLANQMTKEFKRWDDTLKKIVSGAYLTDTSRTPENGPTFDKTHLQKDGPAEILKTKDDPQGIWPIDSNGTKQGPIHLDRRNALIASSPTRSLGRVIRLGPTFGTIPRLPEYQRKGKPDNWAGITDEGVIFVVDKRGTLYTFYQQYEWWNLQRYAGDRGTDDVDERPSKKSFLNLASPPPPPHKDEKEMEAVPRYIWRRIAERPPMPPGLQPPPNKRK